MPKNIPPIKTDIAVARPRLILSHPRCKAGKDLWLVEQYYE
jgi:hypothetical protein